MANSKSRGYIVLEVLAVLLVILLWFVLTQPPKIWEQEKEKEIVCQNHMAALYEAENYYYQKNQSYISDFDSLFSFLQKDTDLQSRKKIVDYSTELNDKIAAILEVPALAELYKIHSAIGEITADFKANQHYLDRDTVFVQTAAKINDELKKLYVAESHQEIDKIFVFIDSLDQLLADITDYKIQSSSQKALKYADSLKNTYSHVQLSQLNSKLSPIVKDLYDFYAILKVSSLAETTNIPDRLKKFTDQMNRANNTFTQFVKDEQISSLGIQIAQLKKLHEDFLAPDKFSLTSNKANLALEETDVQLVAIDKTFKNCPDCGEPYIYTFMPGGGIIIECPNLQQTAKTQLLEELDKIKNFELWNAKETIFKASDSLLIMAKANKKLLRKHREYFMLYKDVESDLLSINRGNILTLKYITNISNMLATLDTNFRISTAEQLLEENLNGLDTLAARCETHEFKYLDNWASLVEQKVMKLDSLAGTFRLKQRERRKLIKLQPVLDYWKTSVADFKNSFKAPYAETLVDVHKELKEKFDNIKNGISERQNIIFHEKHKNHGFVENGSKSWE